MKIATVYAFIESCQDLDALKELSKRVYQRTRAIEKSVQDKKEADAWARLRHLKPGDRIFPHSKIEMWGFPRMNQMVVEVGDYLIVLQVQPRAHRFWLKRKDAPDPKTHAEWRLGRERMHIDCFEMSSAVRYELSADPPTTATPIEPAELIENGLPF